MVRLSVREDVGEAPKSLAHNEGAVYTVFRLLVVISSKCFSHQVDIWSQGCCVWAASAVRCAETCAQNALPACTVLSVAAGMAWGSGGSRKIAWCHIWNLTLSNSS